MTTIKVRPPIDGSAKLSNDEIHPATHSAANWLRDWMKDTREYQRVKERLSRKETHDDEICYETLNCVERGEPIYDRYLLGLCWKLRRISEDGY